MARKARIAFPGARYCVTASGNNGEVIFVSRVDKERFLERLRTCAKRYRLVVLGYSLAGDRLLLVVQTPLGNISAAMQWLLGTYAQDFNRRHGRRGHLFGDRFRSRLLDAVEHVFEALRDVALGRTRAGLCTSPREDRWSSHRAICGLDPPPRFLAVRVVYTLFGRRAYAAYVADSDPDPG